jgi:hypothetical protein
MSDQYNGIAGTRESDRLKVHFGHQRAGGVNHLKPAANGILADLGRDAVSAENRPGAFGNLVHLFHKHGSGLAQTVHNVLVVNDFLADENGWAVEIQSNLDHVDCPHHTGAEPARFEQKNLLLGAGVGAERLQGHKFGVNRKSLRLYQSLGGAEAAKRRNGVPEIRLAVFGAGTVLRSGFKQARTRCAVPSRH